MSQTPIDGPTQQKPLRAMWIALFCLLTIMPLSAAQASVDISTKATQNMSCANGVCAPTAKKAVLNVNDVTTMLATGDLKITTGAGALDIHVKAPFSWTSTSRLTLDAARSTTIEKVVTVAGIGALTLITNDGAKGGDLGFSKNGSVTFWDTNSSLIVNGIAYQLVDNIRELSKAAKINPQGAYALAKDSIPTPFSASPIRVFSGSFEGLGHIISKLSISDTNRRHAVGLFGTNSGLIRDVVFADAQITGSAAAGVVAGENTGQIISVSANGSVSGEDAGYIGGLVGRNFNLIDKSQSSGAVTGAGHEMGGLAGDSQGVIQNSYSTSSLTTSIGSDEGGLVGDNYGSITNSHADGNLTGHSGAVAGGLVGTNEDNASVVLSHATGTVSQAEDAGGLIGGNSGIVSLSSATGSVSAVYVAGGLVGASGKATALVDRCFAIGSVQISAGNEAGGLIGLNYGTTTNAYATGSVSDEVVHGLIGGLVGRNYSTDNQQGSIRTSYSTGVLGTGALIGGLIGQDDKSGFVANSYWDTETSGVSNPAQGAGYPPNDPGITGLTDAQLKSALPDGFDPNVWGQNPNINNGYPYLLANPPPGGNKAAAKSKR